MGLSQAAFSSRIGVSRGTLRNWEQARRTPEGPARLQLALLDRNPRIVEETLEVSCSLSSKSILLGPIALGDIMRRTGMAMRATRTIDDDLN